MAKKIEPEKLLMTPQGVRIVGFLRKKFPKKAKTERGLYELLDKFCAGRVIQKEYQMKSPNAENPADWARLWKGSRRLQQGKTITPPPPRGERVNADETIAVSKIRYNKTQEAAYGWWSDLSPKKRMELIELNYEKVRHLLAGEEE